MTVRKIAVAISGIEVKSTERKEMVRSCTEPSRMPASTPVTSAIGIISAKTQKARMPVLMSARPSRKPTSAFFWKERPKSPCEDAADPFHVALVEGDVQALVLQPVLVVGVGQRLDREAAELVDRELLLELRAVEDDEEDERDHRHDQHHLQQGAAG